MFQYLEQAHRVAYGTGLVPWEYVVGVRSWLIPGALAGLMAAVRAVSDDPAVTAWAVAVAMSLLSLPAIACAFLWGERAGGFAAGLIAGALNAVSFELVYYGVHPLADTIGADLLLPGAYLLDRGVRNKRRGSVAAAGAVLGLAAAVRPQLAPAVLAAAAVFCRLRVRGGYLPLAAGALLPVALAGAVDALTWGAPFRSFVLYVWANHAMNVAADFGVRPWYYYAGKEVLFWSVLAPVLAAALVAGARRRPDLCLVGLAVLLTFSLVGHKEHRFIVPALPFAMTLAGIGSADIGRWLLRRAGRGATERRVAAAGFGFWTAASLLLAGLGGFRAVWFEGAGMIEATRRVNADPDACGLAVLPAKWSWMSGGYALLRPGIALDAFDPGDPPAEAAGFDYVLAFLPADLGPLGFRRVFAAPAPNPESVPVALWRRDGGCAAGAARPLTPRMPPFLPALRGGRRDVTAGDVPCFRADGRLTGPRTGTMVAAPRPAPSRRRAPC